MQYDFQTQVDRSSGGSYKYQEMKMLHPNVSEGIVPLSMADMEWQAPPQLKEGLKAYLDVYPLGYAGPTQAYLDAVCSWMKVRHGWDARPEWIIPMPGVLPGLFAAIQAMTAPGDEILYLSPVFGWFKAGTAMNGRVPLPSSLIHHGKSYEIDYNDLERKASRPSVKAMIFCNPHNPVSRVWRREELERVADICRRHDLYLFSDEVHSDLVMPGYEQISFACLEPELTPKLALFTAPTKAFNLAGMQVGNIFIRDPEMRKAISGQMQANGLFTLGCLSFKAGEIVYSQCGPWLDECISNVWENHQVLKAFVSERLPGIEAYDMEATYLQWMDFRGLGLSDEELNRRLWDNAEVFMDAGTDFGPEGAGFQRMNLACPKDVMLDALERLEKEFIK